MNRIYIGDVVERLREIESESVQCCVTSPPYWGLRDYGHDGQIGLEKTPEEYIAKLVAVFEEVRRVLKKDGTLWLNLGDSYAGSNGNGYKQTLQKTNDAYGGKENHNLNSGRKFGYEKPKDLCMIPARTAIELQRAGWWLRSEIVWHKPNQMPESVRDRPTKSHEMIYLLTKSPTYYYDAEAIYEPAAYDGRKDTMFKGGVKYEGFQEQTMLSRGHERWPKRMKMKSTFGNRNGELNGLHSGEQWEITLKDGVPARNKRDVWTMNTESFDGAHFATFPTELPKTCILAGSRKGDTVLDPFFGSGTTGEMAMRLGRHFIGIDINEKYVREIAEPRVNRVEPLFRDSVIIVTGDTL